jgi:hypothetical protein
VKDLNVFPGVINSGFQGEFRVMGHTLKTILTHYRTKNSTIDFNPLSFGLYC